MIFDNKTEADSWQLYQSAAWKRCMKILSDVKKINIYQKFDEFVSLVVFPIKLMSILVNSWLKQNGIQNSSFLNKIFLFKVSYESWYTANHWKNKKMGYWLFRKINKKTL